jgi:hypothetical protein
MSHPKVLLACPINIVKNYCLPDWLNLVKNLTYPNYDIYLVDNSNNHEYHSQLRHTHNVKIDYINPGQSKEVRDLMAESMEKIRKRVLSHNYDYFFSLECDIFPPAEIIELLMAHDKDVVGCSYFSEHGHNTRMQLLGNKEVSINKFMSYYQAWENVMRFYDGQLKPAFANGIGCILIKRQVLEQITFRVAQYDIGYPDSFFHNDLFMLGIENWVDTSIIPKHWNSRWATIPNDVKHKEMIQKVKSQLIN